MRLSVITTAPIDTSKPQPKPQLTSKKKLWLIGFIVIDFIVIGFIVIGFIKNIITSNNDIPIVPNSNGNHSSPVLQKPSPEEFITYYFALLNRGNYNQAWKYLTPEFRENFNPSYQSYIKFWQDDIQQTIVQRNNVISNNGSISEIYVKLQFYRKDGKPTSPTERKYTLKYNNSLQQWQFYR